MAVVLSSEENTYFSSSTLRRSHSQPKFVTKHPGFHTSSSSSRISDAYQGAKVFGNGDSAPSSSPSSPRTAQVESSDLSCSSTPASNFSLASDCEDDDETFEEVTQDEHNAHIFLPQYDEVGYYHQTDDVEPPPSPRTGTAYTTSPTNDQDIATPSLRPDSPNRAEDDIDLTANPSRHVDYLSHNWREEDIWMSWKFIVSKRKAYANSARLENASWRTWMKAKNKLRTVSPETLNWLKDCDVTWLYGPLQTHSSRVHHIHTDTNSARLSKSGSFVKKPILKKRSMSEVMLQRSISASSLLKQAAAAVQAQQHHGGRRPGMDQRASTDYVVPLSSRRFSTENTTQFPSVESSGIGSPSGERRHIHFNEQVSQCIAVDVKGDDDDDDDLDTDRMAYDSDLDDDYGGVMMKRIAYRKRRPIMKRARSNPGGNTESKTIAMLPSTTLKYRDDTPEPQESALKHSTGTIRSPALSPSSSQETLRPSKKSGKFFVDEDDDEDEDLEPSTPGWSSPPQAGDEPTSSGLRRSSSTNSLTAEPAGMRRTASGMFMPYEEGEAAASEGLFGRVIDTVNTARDIAHVIWNVGWRK